MSGSIVNLVSGSESKTSSASTMEVSLDFHFPLLVHDHMYPKVIFLSDESDSEMVQGDSL